MTKLGRFIRTLEIKLNLSQKDIKVHILNLGIIENLLTGWFILLFLVFLTNLRDMIVDFISKEKVCQGQ